MRFGRTEILVGAALAAGLGAWSLFEAQWVERRRVSLPVEGLPEELEGLRLLHLSDLHLGTLSLGWWTLEQAVRWAEEEPVDVVCITGDLVTRRGGKRALRKALGRLRPRHGVYAVLGNHDVDDARDPFLRPTDLSDLHEVGTVLLRDDAHAFEVGGARIQVVGVHPAAYRARASRPAQRADAGAALRILLCHYPDVVRTLPPRSFDLVLSGHYHGGQICVPSPWGKLRLKDLRANYWEGLFDTPAAALHVSRGLGTSFVPFRLLARPEVTAITLTGKM